MNFHNRFRVLKYEDAELNVSNGAAVDRGLGEK
jgi:hypothetical protein